MSQNISYIYLTTNLINNKKYIGQHTGAIDDNYLGSGIALIQAIEKYGKENFNKQILEICDKEKLNEREKYWIQYYNAFNSEDFYNLTEGGQQGDGWTACNKYMKNHPQEAEQIYQENGIRLHNWLNEHPDIKNQLTRNMLKGAEQWRKDNPDKVQEHMKQLNKAKQQWQNEHPEEYTTQIANFIKAGSDANSKKIRCINTGEIFPSISEAARHYNIYQTNISKVLKGERKSAGKHPETGEKLYWELV